MFHIRHDNKKLHSIGGGEFRKLSAAELETELNKAGKFVFKMPPVHELYNHVACRKSIITVFDDDDMIFKGRVIKQGRDFRNIKTVTAEGEFAYFNDSVYQLTGKGEYDTAVLIPEIINEHNRQVDESRQFRVGNIDSFKVGITSKEVFRTMDLLQTGIVNNTGGYFSVRYKNDVRYVDFLRSPGIEDTSTKIEFGVNLLDIEQYIDSASLCTIIVPYGEIDENTGMPIDISSVNGGKKYIENTAGVEHFGRILKPIKFSGFTDPASMYAEALKFTSALISETIRLDLTAVELRQIDMQNPYSVFKQGNSYRVISKPHGIDEFFRCSKKKTNLFLPENNKVQLGHISSRLTDYI